MAPKFLTHSQVPTAISYLKIIINDIKKLNVNLAFFGQEADVSLFAGVGIVEDEDSDANYTLHVWDVTTSNYYDSNSNIILQKTMHWQYTE